MNVYKALQVGLVACLFSGTVAAQAVDLSSWTANGGSWDLLAQNDSVRQSQNRYPTVFHSGLNSQGLALSGNITVEQTGDDDFIGFVLGYNDGDLNNGAADYILVDWKQADQDLQGGTGVAGLAISQVTGAIGSSSHSSGAWWHDSADGVEELQRGATLGSVGWEDNTTYSFDIIFTASLIEVSVNGNTELSISGLFNNGSFGFYNYSQSGVVYAGIEQGVVPPVSAVPLPAAVFMFAPALLGFMGLRRKAKTMAA